MIRSALLLLLVAVLSATAARGAEDGVATLEGRVVAVATAPAEGGLDGVVVTLATPEGARRVLLAPAKTLADAGFEVRVGDVVRARVFVDEEADALLAHKVLNVTRGTMVRLRTLRRLPAWDATGAWQGGSGGSGGGGHGPGPHGPHGRGPRR